MEPQAHDRTTDEILLGLGLGFISIGSWILLGATPTLLLGGGAIAGYLLYEHRDSLHLTDPAAPAPTLPGAARTRRDTDHCRQCGSDNLFSGYFDHEGYAVPLRVGDGPEYLRHMQAEGVRWTTFCQQCGAEQTSRRRRVDN